VGGTVELTDGGTREPRRDGPDPLIGRRLLHYRVLEVIGLGGMSVVYRGRDENLDRDVAIKVLHPFLAEKAECRQRLAREARAVARLEHPNILKVFDFSGDPATVNDRYPPEERGDERDTDGFLVCELVPGDTLKHFADRCSLWDVPEVGGMAVLRIARALAHAHDNGVVHRDLKPENVMVRDDGVLKLMDFGIAQVVDQKQLTVTGTLLGSPAHMAPESIEGFPADQRSDIFSLGTVLYWLVTGALPFEALTPHALLKKIVEAQPPPPQQRSPRVSDDLSKVIERAMAREPDDRYPSAGEMADALAEVLDRASLPTSDAEISDILRDPARGLADTSTTVRTSFLARAEQLLEAGSAAKALGTLSRVLAEHPGDPDAEALLERAQEGALEEEEEEEAAAASEVARLASEEPGRRRGGLPLAGAVLTVVLLAVAGALVGVGALVDDVTEKTREADATAPDDARPPRAEAKAPEGMSMVPPGGEVPPEAAPGGEAADAPPGRDKQPIRVAPRPVIARRPHPDIAKQPPVRIVDPGSLREVKVVAAPYAHIFVDGREVARNAVSRMLKLAPGDHLLRFEHEHAKTKVVDLNVPASGNVPEVRVVLDEAKPAYLRVEALPPEAEVVVDGILKGTARNSMRTPIVVPFQDMAARARFEVIVHSPGHRTSVVTPQFAAEGAARARPRRGRGPAATDPAGGVTPRGRRRDTSAPCCLAPRWRRTRRARPSWHRSARWCWRSPCPLGRRQRIRLARRPQASRRPPAPVSSRKASRRSSASGAARCTSSTATARAPLLRSRRSPCRASSAMKSSWSKRTGCSRSATSSSAARTR
jgi:serine/threonine-protein kinase